MIAVQSENGELIKVMKNVMDGEFGFHRSFGLISKAKADRRVQTRKLQHFDFTRDEWLCSFKLEAIENAVKISNLVGCEATQIDNGFNIKTPMGNFILTKGVDASINPLLSDIEDKNEWLDKVFYVVFAVIFAFFPIYLLTRKPIPPVVVEEITEPVTVKIQKEVKTVKVLPADFIPTKMITSKVLTKQQAKQAVQRNLGFLGMVGSKDLSKVVGGVPQNLKVATAGAGPGGDAGSGGEVLTGLGKGLRKTTVGNTGVQGLGGIGTKGAGGGLGGYGNTLVASGNGKGISAIAVSNSEMVLEGGLSKYVINATIAKYLSQVRRCYEAELKNSPDIQGLVEMSFEINASGKLNFAKVNRTTLNSRPVEECISTKMMDWQFPQPKGGVTVPVKYPFMLRPVGM